jgi:hypothetical protein
VKTATRLQNRLNDLDPKDPRADEFNRACALCLSLCEQQFYRNSFTTLTDDTLSSNARNLGTGLDVQAVALAATNDPDHAPQAVNIESQRLG